MSELSRRALLQRGAAFALSASVAPAFVAEAAEPAKQVAQHAAPNTAPKVDPYLDAVFVDGEPPKPAADSPIFFRRSGSCLVSVVES